MKNFRSNLIVLMLTVAVLSVWPKAGDAAPFSFLAPGYSAEIVSTPSQGRVGMTFNDDGQLIRRTGNTFYTHSLTADPAATIHTTPTIRSSVASVVSGLPVDGQFHGLARSANDVIYALADNGIYKIDSGVATHLPGTDANNRGTYGIGIHPTTGKLVYNRFIFGDDGAVMAYDFLSQTATVIYNSNSFNDDLVIAPTGEIFIANLGNGGLNSQIDVIDINGNLINEINALRGPDGVALCRDDSVIPNIISLFSSNKADGSVSRYEFSGPGYTGTVTETVVASGLASTADLATTGPDGELYISRLDQVYEDSTTEAGVSIVKLKADDCEFIEEPKEASCISPPLGMVAWFPFDETTGPVAVNYRPGNDGSYEGPGRPNIFDPIGPVPVAGRHQNALRFDGLDDYVNVPDYPGIAGGGYNFAIDAWIKTNDATGSAGIVDKLDSDAGAPGYRLSLQNGELTFEMSDGTTASTFGSGFSVANGLWHHVAVTVVRFGPAAGGRFYVDGQVMATFDPTVIQGSVSSGVPLRIGIYQDSGQSHPFDGLIDEVEIFSFPVSIPDTQVAAPAPSDFIADIYTHGKCKDTMTSAPSTAICNNATDAKINVTVCNNGPDYVERTLSIEGMGTGVLPDGQSCDVDATNEFSILDQQPSLLDLNSGECKTVTLTLSLPSTLVNENEKACYRIDVPGAGATFGTVWKSPFSICPAPFDPAGYFAGCAVGSSFFNRRIPLQNPGAITETLDYQLSVAPPDPLLPNDIISLNGLAPGTAVTGQVTIPPGGTADVVVQTECLTYDRFGLYSLVLSSDADGDAIFDPMTAITLIPEGPDDDSDGDSVINVNDNCVMDANANQRDTDGDNFGNMCDADLNNDSIFNSLDLGLFKLRFFGNDADADINGDGIVNSLDLGLIKGSFFQPPGPSALAP